jgi:hypothetical protein
MHFGSTISQLSNVPIDASGTATLSGGVLNGLGTHTITASYAGVAYTFLASNGTGIMAVNQASQKRIGEDEIREAP